MDVASEEKAVAASPRAGGWSRPGTDDGEGRFLTDGSSRTQLRAQRRIFRRLPFSPFPRRVYGVNGTFAADGVSGGTTPCQSRHAPLNAPLALHPGWSEPAKIQENQT
jgi:hypothetical protein